MNLRKGALVLSNALQPFPRLHAPARRVYCIFNPGARFHIERTFKQHKTVFVLKIGANDGLESDPIGDIMLSDSRYRGILVEPIPAYARMLAANVDPCGRFTIEQVAITSISGTVKMFYVTEDEGALDGRTFPSWLRGIASLDRSHVLKHLPPDMASLIVETSVECVSVPDLLARNKVHQVDLLHIDAEGHDYVILNQFDFTAFRPQIVLFEHKHLHSKEKHAAESLLKCHGYDVKHLETDYLCLARS